MYKGNDSVVELVGPYFCGKAAGAVNGIRQLALG